MPVRVLHCKRSATYRVPCGSDFPSIFFDPDPLPERIIRGMMVSKWSLSSFVAEVVRNAVEVLAQAEWKAEMEHRLCSGIRPSMTKVNTADHSSDEALPIRGTAIHMPRISVEKLKSRPQ